VSHDGARGNHRRALDVARSADPANPVAISIDEEDVTVARCITCGTPLHPERAEKYDYCTKPECRAKNARSLTIAAVGVNKAADQFVVLDERTQEEMAGGRYLDARRASSIAPTPPPRRRRSHPAETPVARRPRPQQPTESWTESQQHLALALHMTGKKTLEEISERLKLRSDTVAEMIVAAKRRWKR
jgi:hypothetical protein